MAGRSGVGAERISGYWDSAAPGAWQPLATLALAVLLAAWSVMLLFLAGQGAARVGAIVVGEALPSATFYHEGRYLPLTLLMRSEDRLLLIKFFDPGCPACQKDHADFRDWYRQYNPSGLSVVIVTAGEPLPPAGAGVHWVRDPELVTSRARFQIAATPSYVLVDREGRVLYAQRGRVVRGGENKLLEALDRFLGDH